MTPQESGLRIQKRRLELGMSQVQLAQKIGRSRTTIGKWERGSAFPRKSSLHRLAKALGAPEERFDSNNVWSAKRHRTALYVEARDKYGVENQLRKGAEEASEFCTAIQHAVGRALSPEYVAKLIEEAADVHIMLEQFEILLVDHDFANRVEKVRYQKLNRLHHRLAGLPYAEQTPLEVGP